MAEKRETKSKILYVITKGNFGGAQRYVYDLATGLPKDRFDTIVACGNKDGNILQQKLSLQNVSTITLENSEREINLKNDLKTVRDLIKIIKREKPAVIHLNSSKIGVLGALAVLYVKLTSTHCPKSIFTAHGWAFNEPSRPLFSKIIYYVAHYFTVIITDFTIAVSEKSKKDITYLPFIDCKIKVIYNGIADFDTLPKNEARQILSAQDSNKIIIFSIAELHNNKGLDVALKALSSLPKEIKEKIIYCIAGNGEEKENLEKMISELGITEIVKLLGFVSEAKKLLSGADIFLLPSRTENFPYAILEAGMKGLPVIASSVGGIPEVIDDMQNGILVHPRNPKEIAEAISYLLNHAGKQKEFGDKIKKTVASSFSLEKMLKETVNLYS